MCELGGIRPILVVPDAEAALQFISTVFDGQRNDAAFTRDEDGYVFHSEIVVQGTTLMVIDRRPNWSFTPGTLMVPVQRPEVTFAKAVATGATPITHPTDFFGGTLARFQDPWHNLWWICNLPIENTATWEDDSVDTARTTVWQKGLSPQMDYIYETLVFALANLQEHTNVDTMSSARTNPIQSQ